MPKKIILLTENQKQVLAYCASYVSYMKQSHINLRLSVDVEKRNQSVQEISERQLKTSKLFSIIENDPILLRTISYFTAIKEINNCLILTYSPEKTNSHTKEELKKAEQIILENKGRHSSEGTTDDGLLKRNALDDTFLSCTDLKLPDSTLNGLNDLGLIKGEDFGFNDVETFDDFKGKLLKAVLKQTNNDEAKSAINEYWNFENQKPATFIADFKLQPSIRTERKPIFGIENSNFKIFSKELFIDDKCPKKYRIAYESTFSLFRDGQVYSSLKKGNSKEILTLIKKQKKPFEFLTDYGHLRRIIESNPKALSEVMNVLPSDVRAKFFDPNDILREFIIEHLRSEVKVLRLGYRYNDYGKKFERRPLVEDVQSKKSLLLEEMLNGFDVDDRKIIFRNFLSKDPSIYPLDCVLSKEHLTEFLNTLSIKEKIAYFKNTIDYIDQFPPINPDDKIPESDALRVNSLFSLEEDQMDSILKGLNTKFRDWYCNFPLDNLVHKELISTTERGEVLLQIEKRLKHSEIKNVDFLKNLALDPVEKELIEKIITPKSSATDDSPERIEASNLKETSLDPFGNSFTDNTDILTPDTPNSSKAKLGKLAAVHGTEIFPPKRLRIKKLLKTPALSFDFIKKLSLSGVPSKENLVEPPAVDHNTKREEKGTSPDSSNIDSTSKLNKLTNPLILPDSPRDDPTKGKGKAEGKKNEPTKTKSGPSIG